MSRFQGACRNASGRGRAAGIRKLAQVSQYGAHVWQRSVWLASAFRLMISSHPGSRCIQSAPPSASSRRIRDCSAFDAVTSCTSPSHLIGCALLVSTEIGLQGLTHRLWHVRHSTAICVDDILAILTISSVLLLVVFCLRVLISSQSSSVRQSFDFTSLQLSWIRSSCAVCWICSSCCPLRPLASFCPGKNSLAASLTQQQ